MLMDYFKNLQCMLSGVAHASLTDIVGKPQAKFFARNGWDQKIYGWFFG